MFAFIVVAATVLATAALNRHHYTKSGVCENSVKCNYVYNAKAELAAQDSKVDTIVSANVGIWCESRGVLNEVPMTRYCMDINKVTVTNSTDSKVISADGIDRKMKNWFCFGRDESTGRIAAVFHPENEKQSSLDFKRSIASAFQANFKGTASEEEISAHSHHIAHYSYEENGKQTRRVDLDDVFEFSEGPPDPSIDYQMKEETVVQNSNCKIFSSKGHQSVGMVQSNEYNDDDYAYADGDDDEQLLSEVQTISSYTLTFLNEEEGTYETHSARYAQSHAHLSELLQNAKAYSLLVRSNRDEREKREIKELKEYLPSVNEFLRRIRRSTISQTENSEMIQILKYLLRLEQKHGFSEASSSTRSKLINHLQNIFNDPSDVAQKSRLIIYGLLSNEGSEAAQQMLLKALENQIDPFERSSLLIYFGLLPSVNASTEEKLRDMLNKSDDLILPYASLGRHSNVEETVILTLANKFSDRINSSSANEEEKVHSILAFGNTGSSSIIPIITPYLFSSSSGLQLATIEALRTVSRNPEVQNAFTMYISGAQSEVQVVKVMESMEFPFHISVYFPRPSSKKDVAPEEKQLMEAAVDAALSFKSDPLKQSVLAYLRNIDTEQARQLQAMLLDPSATNTSSIREKRHVLNDDLSDDRNINTQVGSLSSLRRSAYKYHTSYQWQKQIKPVSKWDLSFKTAFSAFLGYSDLYGGKVTMKFKADGRIFGRSTRLTEWNFEYTPTTKALINMAKRIGGISLVIKFTTDCKLSSAVSYSHIVLDTSVPIHVYVGSLHLHIRVSVNAKFSMNLGVKPKNTLGIGRVQVDAGARISKSSKVKKLGLVEIGLSLSVSTTCNGKFEGKTEHCDRRPSGDMTMCIDGGLRLRLDVNGDAWYKRRTCSRYGWRNLFIRCGHWSGKNSVGLIPHKSFSYAPTYHKCKVCRCSGRSGLCDAEDPCPNGSYQCVWKRSPGSTHIDFNKFTCFNFATSEGMYLNIINGVEENLIISSKLSSSSSIPFRKIFKFYISRRHMQMSKLAVLTLQNTRTKFAIKAASGKIFVDWMNTDTSRYVVFPPKPKGVSSSLAELGYSPNGVLSVLILDSKKKVSIQTIAPNMNTPVLPPVKETIVSPKLRDWMSHYGHILGRLKLHEMTLPATHDSGTYKMFNPLGRPWAQTQTISLLNQLQHGVRVLDLRIGQKGPDQYIIVHDIWITVTTIEKALDDIITFAQNAKKEIVFLRFKNFIALDGKTFDYNCLKNKVYSKLRGYILLPKCRSYTLSKIWKHCPRKNLIIFWNGKDIDTRYMLPGMDERWYNVKSRKELFNKIKEDLSEPRYTKKFKEKLWIISAFTSTTLTGTPNNNAIALNPTLSHWFYGGSTWAYKANVISTDFFNEYSNFVQASVVSSLLKAGEKK